MPSQAQDDLPVRAIGMLVIEVVDSNPNGDPDRESDPRQRPDGRGEISSVSFKRKVRDLVEEKEGPVWKILQHEMSLRDENHVILERRGRNRPEIMKELENETFFRAKYWDGRVFGNTFLEKAGKSNDGDDSNDVEDSDAKTESDQSKTKSVTSKRSKKGELSTVDKLNTIKTGAVQFALGISVAPIAINRRTTTNKAGVQGGLVQGMAPLSHRTVQHAVYVMPFFVNPTAAVKSGCTRTDVDLLYRLIPQAYPHSASYARPWVWVRHAWVVEHKSPLGSYSDFAILDALRPKIKPHLDPNQPSTSWSDYDVPTELAPEIRDRIASFRDLVNE